MERWEEALRIAAAMDDSRAPRRLPILGRVEDRRRARREAELAADVAAAEALRPHTRTIWLDPDYFADPVWSDVEPPLGGLVWTSRSLPIGEATRSTLREAMARYDEAYLGEDEDDQREAQRTWEALVDRLRLELGAEWTVGFFSQALDRPVWNVDELPADEWHVRFHRDDDL